MYFTILFIVLGLCENKMKEYNNLKGNLKMEGFGSDSKESEMSSDDTPMDVSSEDKNPGKGLLNNFFKGNNKAKNQMALQESASNSENSTEKEDQIKKALKRKKNKDLTDYDILDSKEKEKHVKDSSDENSSVNSEDFNDKPKPKNDYTENPKGKNSVKKTKYTPAPKKIKEKREEDSDEKKNARKQNDKAENERKSEKNRKTKKSKKDDSDDSNDQKEKKHARNLN